MDENIMNESATNEAPRYSEAICQRAPLMAKWLWVLFWANIASIIINLIKIESSEIYTAVQSGSTLICALIICASLYMMRSEDKRYGLAALFQLIAVAFNFCISFIFGSLDASFFAILISLVSSVLSLLAVYNEYHAHSCIVGGLDCDLGDRWQKLWVWQIIGIAGTFIALLLTILAAGFGAVLVILVAIYVLVIQIIYLVTLYRSAKAYRAVVAYMAKGE